MGEPCRQEWKLTAGLWLRTPHGFRWFNEGTIIKSNDRPTTAAIPMNHAALYAELNEPRGWEKITDGRTVRAKAIKARRCSRCGHKLRMKKIDALVEEQ